MNENPHSERAHTHALCALCRCCLLSEPGALLPPSTSCAGAGDMALLPPISATVGVLYTAKDVRLSATPDDFTCFLPVLLAAPRCKCRCFDKCICILGVAAQRALHDWRDTARRSACAGLWYRERPQLHCACFCSLAPGQQVGIVVASTCSIAWHRGASNNRDSIATGRTIDNAWHWFDGLPGAALDSIFTPSSCQRLLQSPGEIARLHRLDALSRNQSLATAAAALGFGDRAFDATTQAVRALGRGFTLADVPAQFRKHGMLWWWQVLSTYLIRVRGPLAERWKAHPALEHMRARQRSAVYLPSTMAQRDWLRASRSALRRAGSKGPNNDLGWVPSAVFDAALHVRMGDACGPRAKKNQGIVRKCVLSLHAGLAPLLAHGIVPAGGHVFLATDSPKIVAEAAAASASLPFTVHYFAFNRDKYDRKRGLNSRRQGSYAAPHPGGDDARYLDALRARYIAGSMYGNVPRVALQLRPTQPGDKNRLSYVTTDGRDWCTLPTCSRNNTGTGRFW